MAGTLGQLVRDILRQARRDGLAGFPGKVEELTAGGLVGCANILAEHERRRLAITDEGLKQRVLAAGGEVTRSINYEFGDDVYLFTSADGLRAFLRGGGRAGQDQAG